MFWIPDDEGEDCLPPPIPRNCKEIVDLPWNQKICSHDWKKIVLITSSVYDCAKCGVKKEDYERWKKE
jgi:hypothetical protein